MDWLNQHLCRTIALLPVVFLSLASGKQIAAQQGRPLPALPSASGSTSTPGSGVLSTPGMGTVGSEAVPSPGIQPPNPFRAPEMPPLAPESLPPMAPTPTPGEHRPEKDQLGAWIVLNGRLVPTRYSPLPSNKYLAAIHSKPSLRAICASSGMTCSESRYPPLPRNRRAGGAGLHPGAGGCDAGLSVGDGR
jgi:hypothetical protein